MAKSEGKNINSKARGLELEAFRLENRIKRYDKNETVSDAFLSAARAYSRIGDISRAKSNYKDAIRHGKENTRYEIEAELAELARPEKMLQPKLQHSLAYAAIVFLLGALIFISSNLTGYAILNTNQDTLKWVGVILFIIGLIFAIVYLKSKEGKKSTKRKKK